MANVLQNSSRDGKICRVIHNLLFSYTLMAYMALDFLTPTQYWPMIESSLGILGACLPTYSPLYKKVSLESIIASVRSMISLRSVNSSRSPRTQAVSNNKDSASLSSEAKIVEEGRSSGDVYQGYAVPVAISFASG